MRAVYVLIFDLLSPQERQRFWLLVLLVMAMGLFDVLGVASVLPFLAVVSNPDTVQNSDWLSWFYRISGAESLSDFMMILGVTVFLFVLLTTLVRAAAFYAAHGFIRLPELKKRKAWRKRK